MGADTDALVKKSNLWKSPPLENGGVREIIRVGAGMDKCSLVFPANKGHAEGS